MGAAEFTLLLGLIGLPIGSSSTSALTGSL